MRTYIARIREIRLEAQGSAAWIDCPSTSVPRPGQYVLASNVAEPDDPLAAALFPADYGEDGFLASPPVPPTWMPGTEMRMNGPLGKGFSLPYNVRRLALIDLDGNVQRLLPLVTAGLANSADVALFSDAPPASLPSSVEINSLENVSEALNWADFLAVGVALKQVESLGECLGLAPGRHLSCPGQVLVAAPMPCGGAAECGACAIRVRRRWKLACSDGPVFDLNDLLMG